MKRYLLIMLFAALSAQKCSAWEELPDSIRSLVTSQTAIVGWISLDKADPNQFSDLIGRQSEADSNGLESIRNIREKLLQVGVKKLFWVSDSAGFVQGPQAVLIPVSPEQQNEVSAIVQAFVSAHDATVAMQNGVVVVGRAEAVRHSKPADPVSSDDELVRLISEVNSSHGLVIRPIESFVQSIRQSLPSVAGPSNDFVKRACESMGTIEFLCVTTELPPTNATLRIVTRDAENARKLCILLNEWIAKTDLEAASVLAFTSEGNEVRLVSGSTDQTVSMIHEIRMLTTGTTRPNAVNSMRKLALAMHNYNAVYGHFPPASLTDSSGKPLLSWRVLILPFLGEQELYQQFRLNEPWDSEHNLKLVQRMPNVYLTRPAYRPSGPDSVKTRFVAPLTHESVFGRPGAPVALKEISDGLSNTLLLMEALPERSVIWSKPEDAVIDDELPAASFFDKDHDHCLTAFCDGSTRRISIMIPADQLRALLTIGGGESVDPNKL